MDYVKQALREIERIQEISKLKERMSSLEERFNELEQK